MIKVNSLINLLKRNKSDFFTGVPDSVLKDLSTVLQKKNKQQHIIASNEGAAVSIGIGHYLSTNKIPTIYMQNSGLSNALNPLISIAHEKVYSIPLILIIGWRGSPRIKDEPQHNVKGKITEQILKLLNIKYTILRSVSDINKFDKQIKLAKKKKSIVACLIEQGTLEKIKNTKKKKDFYNLDKELFLKSLLENLTNNTKIISSTGYNSRELMYIRKKYNFNISKDFYMVGGMGHSSSVGVGYALSSKKKVFCLDGDGSILMHLGALRTVGYLKNNNFKHIILNNNSHESVGGQLTNAAGIDFNKFRESIGYRNYYKIENKNNIKNIIKKFINSNGPSLLEVKIKNGSLKNLSRPENLLKIKEK